MVRLGHRQGSQTVVPSSDFDWEEAYVYIGAGHSEGGIIRGKAMERKQFFDDNAT